MNWFTIVIILSRFKKTGTFNKNVFCWWNILRVYGQKPTDSRVLLMDLFSASKCGVYDSDDNSLRECRSCNNKMRLIRLVHYPETEATVRVFECDCGERTWDE